MFSKILIKLIDQAIVPALLILTTRVVSIVLISRYLSIDITFSNNGFTFSNPAEYILINSYSMFCMILVLVVGLSYNLIKAYIFHDTHIKPGTTARVFSYRMSHLIQSSYDLYTQGAIWLSYTYLLATVAGIMSSFGLVYRWVFSVTFIIGIIVTVFFILDIEHEIKIEKGNREPELDIDWSDHLEPEGDLPNA